MITNDELLETPEYWTSRIQLDLYSHLQEYMKANGLNRTQLAQKLGVTKGYITQMLNGNFDHRLSKLVELSLAVGLIPKMEFVPKVDFFKKNMPKPKAQVMDNYVIPPVNLMGMAFQEIDLNYEHGDIDL